MAVSDMTWQISWIKSLLGKIHSSILKVLLYYDNQGVIFLATNPAQEQHSKHIGIRYHYICECVEEGDNIDLFYIPTGEQIADIFTKNLSPVKFKDMHRGLCMISYSPYS